MKRFFIILLGALCLCGHAAAQTQADFSRLTEDNHPRLLFTDISFKDLKGIIFNLENNYGYREKLDVSNESMESFLQRAMDDEAGREF